MKDDKLGIVDYLPGDFSSTNEADYVAFWEGVVVQGIESGNYHVAFLGHHMLFMVAVEYLALRLSRYYPREYRASLAHLVRREDRAALSLPSSPFSFSIVNERTIFTLFEITGVKGDTIKSARGMVDDRNNAIHANGLIFFSEDFSGLQRMMSSHEGLLSQLLASFHDKTTEIILSQLSGGAEEDRVSVIAELGRKEYVTSVELRAIAGIEPE